MENKSIIKRKNVILHLTESSSLYTEEIEKFQKEHEQKVAESYGFENYQKLLEYTNMCCRNINWFRKQEIADIFSKECIAKYLKDKKLFHNKIIAYEQSLYLSPVVKIRSFIFVNKQKSESDWRKW